METSSHSASASALGYYYQAIYALKLLFESDNNNSSVSIETLDDVYLETGSRKELHQLKHSVKENTKITLKHENLWKTLKVWCDHINTSNDLECHFILSTVSEVTEESNLNILLNNESNRDLLEKELLDEAERILAARQAAEIENENLQKEGKKVNSLPFEKKFKGCYAFKHLPSEKRRFLLQRMHIYPGQFSISEAMDMVKQNIKHSTQPQNLEELAKAILAWWDREVLESLTKERLERIYKTELLEFISKKNAELYNDGLTDDLADITLPAITNPHPFHIKQLEIIEATETQKKRSFETEMKARVQRSLWMERNLPAIIKLKRYDEQLIKEWSYKFDETESVKETLSEEEQKLKGRELLDWTHKEAHLQVAPISNTYNNPDLIRGSYQMLSTSLHVGWHCNYKTLINHDETDK